MTFQRPFLKWAGGKYGLLDAIRAHLPEGKRLIEPFAGAGVVSLNMHYTRFWLNDLNSDLIQTYQALLKDPTLFIKQAKRYFQARYNDEAAYYRMRKRFNQTDAKALRSLLFLYLNRHGYNGLCRYNQSGGFNVPFGRYKAPFFPEEALLNFHQHFKKRIKLSTGSFENIFAKATLGDVIYCDPPYLPLNSTAYFTQYTQHQFGMLEQERLAQLAFEASEKGIPVLISNHDTRLARHLYQKATLTRLPAKRMISCHAKTRTPVFELLALFDAK